MVWLSPANSCLRLCVRCAFEVEMFSLQSNMEQGLFVFRYGDAVVEFLHVDNLVQAHILAAEALRPHRDTGTAAVSNSC